MIAEYDVPNDVGPTASIGSVSAVSSPDTIDIKNIQFNRIEKVWVVVDDGSKQSDLPPQELYFANNDGDLSLTQSAPGDIVIGGFVIGGDETITVTVYETDSKNNQLATATTKAT
jgi:hypothetical protein